MEVKDIKIGMIAQLKSCSPYMTVDSVNIPDKIVKCIWCVDGRFHEKVFYADTLIFFDTLPITNQ